MIPKSEHIAIKVLRKPPCDTKDLERIGRCDGCGLIDHHLLFGLCPTCVDKEEDEHVPT